MAIDTEYQQLVATGLWRASPEGQRREVTVTIGAETLILSDDQARAVAHWSLPALVRANPGVIPAIYHPDGDPGETLELAETEDQMIRALDKLRTAIERRRPHPGRLRMVLLVLMLGAVIIGGVFWLPDALRRHAVSVVPQAKRAEIGEALKEEITRVSGPACDWADGQEALNRLATRIAPQDKRLRLRVVEEAVRGALFLPGREILINKRLIEDYEEPDVVAGFVLNELLRAAATDPLDDLLRFAGARASFQLLTIGDMPGGALRKYAEHLLTNDRTALDTAALLNRFANAQVRSSPYAYALDLSGESTLPLIEGDPFRAEAPPPLLPDADWLRLQEICE
ncbi:hypothetical protein [Pseudooceanicola onchidii]|uniref:hypothetical protein n=1 Tax=Pseudooceanicola onchidii TaxID=2562279 RepID=UPI0010AA9909|nr:hypothetical protein [Pseudooceanicola onchidii]